MSGVMYVQEGDNNDDHRQAETSHDHTGHQNSLDMNSSNFTEEQIRKETIILSLLEDVVFSGNVSHDIISSKNLAHIQKSLLELKNTLPQSSFLKLPATSTCKAYNEDPGTSLSAKLHNLDPEKLRYLVSKEIRNLAKSIIEIYSPFLHKTTSKTIDDCTILSKLGEICQILEKSSEEIEREKDKFKRDEKNWDDQFSKLTNSTKEFENALRELAQLSINDKEKEDTYYKDAQKLLELEQEDLRLQMEIAKLEVDLGSNAPSVMEEMDRKFELLRDMERRLENEVEEQEKILKKYTELGDPMKELVKEYEELERQISTQEWVKSELENASGNNSFI